MNKSDYSFLRKQMVEEQLVARDITDERVLKAMGQVPRECFVPKSKQALAYIDSPLSIGTNQTISQPYIIALMCQLLELTGSEKVLDVGSGSGYESAVLSLLAKKIIALEMDQSLIDKARRIALKLEYDNITFIQKDAREGYQKLAPYDAIKSAAASERIPKTWRNQLKEQGKMVLPLIQSKFFLSQKLVKVIKKQDSLHKKIITNVRFVPLK